MSDIQGPGTASYSPAYSAPDNVVLYGTRSSMRTFANGTSLTMPVVGDLMPPDPALGGEHGQADQLGWSTGFGAFRRRTSFTGRVITRPTMGANPRTGPVGYSTRTARLRQRIEALYTDYTPSNQAVAREVIEGGLR